MKIHRIIGAKVSSSSILLLLVLAVLPSSGCTKQDSDSPELAVKRLATAAKARDAEVFLEQWAKPEKSFWKGQNHNHFRNL